MRYLLLSILVLASHAVWADAFDYRLAQAKAALTANEGTGYESVMNRHLEEADAKIMRGCFGAISAPDTSAFVVVADVSSSGKLSAIAVRPQTNISRCFAQGLANDVFPSPPLVQYQQSFPIFIEMSITP
jgi:hypothetical protein